VAAWKQTINVRYASCLINSERGLQAYFCAALLEQFDNLSRRIFIEPRLSQAGVKGSRYPDVVICHSEQIIGVVELKYQPRGRPTYEKDLNTLRWIAENHEQIKVSNDRYFGPPAKARVFSLAPDAVLCWAGVYKGAQENVSQFVPTELKARFLGLHALTSQDGAEIACNFRSSR